jgi:hypothetical protein
MHQDGVIILHDTMVRTEPFDVWRVWQEIEKAYPKRTFNFEHSNGLGIVCLGKKNLHDLHKICRASNVDKKILQNVFKDLGADIVEISKFELALIERSGGTVKPDHVFARASKVPALRNVMAFNQRNAVPKSQAEQSEAAAEARLLEKINAVLEPRFEQVSKDVFSRVEAAFSTMLQARLGDINAALEQRYIEGITRTAKSLSVLDGQLRKAAAATAKVASQTARDMAALNANLKKDIRASDSETAKKIIAHFERDFDAQLQKRTDDLHKALSPAFEKDIHAALEPSLAEASTRNWRKNDVQDDAILYVSEMTVEHGKAIEILRKYLQDLYSHPLFR